MCSVMFQVVDPKRGSADPSPWVTSGSPRLSTKEGFTALSSEALLLHELTKVGPDQIIASSDIELS